ncbi:MAG: hypothetical protein ABEJ40_10245 [Haloarculaceae archaeon]
MGSLPDPLDVAVRNLRGAGIGAVREFAWRSALRYGRRLSADPVFDADWDVLVVLDACRADLWAEVVGSDSDFPVGATRISPGGTSTEWLDAVFGERDPAELAGVGYVTANPYSESHVDASALAHCEEVWRYAWDDDLGTVPPRPVTDAAIRAWRARDLDRLVVHYMQPHFPSLAGDPRYDRDRGGQVSKDADRPGPTGDADRPGPTGGADRAGAPGAPDDRAVTADQTDEFPSDQPSGHSVAREVGTNGRGPAVDRGGGIDRGRNGTGASEERGGDGGRGGDGTGAEYDDGIALADFGEESLSVWEDLRFGRRSRAEVWEAYRENLEIVLEDVRVLLSNADADPVVVTADHGNGFGERGIFGHAAGVALRPIREVPWAVTSAVDRQTYDPPERPPEAGAEPAADESVQERLRELGYR